MKRIIMIAKCLTGLVLLAAFGGTVHAAPLTWTNWTAATSGSATGTLGSISVTFSGQVDTGDTQTNGGIYFWGTNSAIYTPTGTENPPPDADIIALDGGSYLTQTVTFSDPVVNPLMAVASIGTLWSGGLQQDYNFNQPFTILNSGNSWWTPFCCSQLWQTGNVLHGLEGAGLIQFQGTYSSISWTVPIYEDYSGFQIGYVDAQQSAVPIPAAAWMFGSALGVLGVIRRKMRG
jgi:hypothetical protein